MRRALQLLLAAVLITSFLAPAFPAAASVAVTTDSLAVNWATWLPSFVDEYAEGSADVCLSGQNACAAKAIREMEGNLGELLSQCSHNSVFSLAYLRITQGYDWSRATTDPDGTPYYDNVRGMNYVVEVFARAYLGAFQQWSADPLSPSVPLSWKIAFDAAKDKRVTGTGDLLLGINAHINRDLAFVMAAAGLVNADGTSRKPDYDKVNELLFRLIRALNAELGQRLDPSIGTDQNGLSDPATFQLIVGWREQAWRNAEALVKANSDSERALVARRIEDNATAQAALILASNSYVPLLTSTTSRDNHCAGHRYDPAPIAYPFATTTKG